MSEINFIDIKDVLIVKKVGLYKIIISTSNNSFFYETKNLIQNSPISFEFIAVFKNLDVNVNIKGFEKMTFIDNNSKII